MLLVPMVCSLVGAIARLQFVTLTESMPPAPSPTPAMSYPVARHLARGVNELFTTLKWE